jgi:hypothetical protein
MQLHSTGSQNPYILHYLDIFLFARPSDSLVCASTLSYFRGICADIGVPIAEEKKHTPFHLHCFPWHQVLYSRNGNEAPYRKKKYPYPGCGTASNFKLKGHIKVSSSSLDASTLHAGS